MSTFSSPGLHPTSIGNMNANKCNMGAVPHYKPIILNLYRLPNNVRVTLKRYKIPVNM